MVTQVYAVATATDFKNAISAINRGQAQAAINTVYTFDITASFSQAGSELPALILETGSSLVINGGGFTVTGGGATRGLLQLTGGLTINNLSFSGMAATGGAGGSGDGAAGGGGAGLGAGLFVGANNTATVNVGSFSGAAAGGAGGDGHGLRNGGGGGMGGAGGDGGATNRSGGGGGAGVGASGGNEAVANGGAGIALGLGAGAIGLDSVGGVRGLGGASGGGGGASTNGGGGGGWGGGGVDNTGQNGGMGGGGGGSSGLGGFVAGMGGFGGGGGGGLAGGGAGGFGGGGGSGFLNNGGGAAGFGGGAGGGGVTQAGAGGGLGAGGGVFLGASANLILNGGGTLAGTATGGLGGPPGPVGGAGGAGGGFGGAVFMQGGAVLTLAPDAGQTLSVTGSIADQTGSGGTAGNAGAGSLIINGAATGIVSLTTANTYTGGTALRGGTLVLGNATAAGTTAGSVISFDTGAQTLRLNYAIAGGPTFGNTIAGFGVGDVIDLRTVAAATGVELTGNVLKLKNGGADLISFNLQAGHGLVAGNFGLAADGFGGTNLSWIVPVPATPPTTSAPAEPPLPPPSKAPTVSANFNNLLRYSNTPTNPLPATVTTPDGKVLPNPLIEQQKAVAALIIRVDAGTLTLKAAQDIIVDMADATTSVATMSYQFFTHRLPTGEGLDFLTNSPLNPNDINDGYYAGMSLENRYINMAVNLGKNGEGRADFQAGYGALSLGDATAKAYAEIFGKPADAAKLAAILTPERVAYFNALGGDALGAKAAMVGFFLGESAKADVGPYAVANENFLYDLMDGRAAFGADASIYLGAGPTSVGLIGRAEADAGY